MSSLDRNTLRWCLDLVEVKMAAAYSGAVDAMKDGDATLANELEMAETYLEDVAEEINAEITETY